MSRTSLLLCHRLPFPPNKGDKIRSHALLKHLAEQGPVHVGCFVDDAADRQYLGDVRRLAGGECRVIPLNNFTKWIRAAAALCSGQPITTSYFGNRSLAGWVRDILVRGPIDNLVVFGSAMAPYLLETSIDANRVLFDMVDVDSDKWRQYAAASGGVLRWIYSREARLLEQLERRAANRFGKTLLVSPFEAETFRELAPESAARIDSLTNGVDLEKFSLGEFPNPFPDRETPIVMTGRMDYRPNHDGAIWFTEQVGPRLFDRLPNAHLYFVGSNPPTSLQRLAGPKVTVTGSVDDVRPFIRHAAVVVAPLLMARGVQNKVLEAMAMGKAVVATREATRALNVTNGKQLWIENDPAGFSDAVIAAVQPGTRDRVAVSARCYVEENHNWQTILRGLDSRLAQLRKDVTPSSLMTMQAPETVSHLYERNITGAKA